MKRTLLILSISTMLTGCAWMTGLENAEDDFACSVEMPAMCASLTAIHESIDSPQEKVKVELKKSSQSPISIGENADSLMRVALQNEAPSDIDTQLGAAPDTRHLPQRSREEIARIWLAPYVDQAGELYGEQFVWVTVKAARWQGLSPIPVEDDAPRLMRPLDRPINRSRAKESQ